MFTGIIEAVGEVVALEPTAEDGAVLDVRAPQIAPHLTDGASLAVAGVCLTATPSPETGVIRAEIMGETLRRTRLGSVRPGDLLNLERAVPANGRLDGHIVQGHVDAVGTVRGVDDRGDWTLVRIGVPADRAPLLVEKGSVAVDGTSLTVTAVSEAGDAEPWFEIGLIPATLERTTLGSLAAGDPVDVETDVLVRHLARLAAFAAAR